MLLKKRRVDKKLFNIIIQNGTSYNGKGLYLKYLKTPNQHTRITFSIPKKIEKNAVKRNKLKRQGVGVIKELLPQIKEESAIIIFLKNKNTKNLKGQIHTIMNLSGLLNKKIENPNKQE